MQLTALCVLMWKPFEFGFTKFCFHYITFSFHCLSLFSEFIKLTESKPISQAFDCVKLISHFHIFVWSHSVKSGMFSFVLCWFRRSSTYDRTSNISGFCYLSPIQPIVQLIASCSLIFMSPNFELSIMVYYCAFQKSGNVKKVKRFVFFICWQLYNSFSPLRLITSYRERRLSFTVFWFRRPCRVHTCRVHTVKSREVLISKLSKRLE